MTLTNNNTVTPEPAPTKEGISGLGSPIGSLLFHEAGGIAIYHGNCEQVLPFLEPVDLVLTDPPYGIGESTGKNRNSSNKAITRDYGSDDWDARPAPTWILGILRDMSRHQIIFGGNYFDLPPSRCWLVWDKDNTGERADCELAWTNIDAAVRRIKWRWNGMIQEQGGDKKEPRYHPTQKPVAVMRWAINQAPDDVETILDPFMGSGTTLVAAKLEGKRAIGIEREERYCEIAAERLRQGVLF